MKVVWLVLVMTLVISNAQAQFFSGFLRQKGANRKLLAQQIVALNVYSGYIKRGYGVAKDGLKLVNDFKDGEFSLHKDYFNSLKQVSPAVRKYAKVADIIRIQQGIIVKVFEYKRQLSSSSFITTEERNYLIQVFARLLEDCAQLVRDLSDLTTFGNYEMTDAERFAYIDRLYMETNEQQKFVDGFGEEALMLSRQRRIEAESVERLRKIFDGK